MRKELNADVAITNGGTIRSDNVYEAGPISMKTLLLMFPFPDIMVVAKATGQDLWDGLENGVSFVQHLFNIVFEI